MIVSVGRRPRLGPGLIALAVAGCSAVPRGQLEDSHQQILALRAELAQTADRAATLRTQNREIAARSVEDERRIAALEQANEHLERSVIAYQTERDQYAASLREIKSRVLASAAPGRPTALRERLERFSADHPDCRYDAASGLLVVRVDRLFRGETDALTEPGAALVEALGAALIGAAGPSPSARIVATREGDAVRLASGTPRPDLGLRRAETLRERLASASGLDPRRISASVDADEPSPPDADRTIRIQWVAGLGDRVGS